MLFLKMNLSELMVPYEQMLVVGKLIGRHVDVFEEEGYFISAADMLEILEQLGCEWNDSSSKMNSSEVSKMNPLASSHEVSENQDFDTAYPEVLLDMIRRSDQNLIRCIFDYRNVSLKEVALRYGGRSAAANLSNLMAKTNQELTSMRSSTIERLATALECPVEWIAIVRHPEKMVLLKRE